ncbi:MAG TPA: hypothetical protein VF310_16815 [Vicinamibacteria bacterium]
MSKRIAWMAGAWLLAAALPAAAAEPARSPQPDRLLVYCTGAASPEGLQSPDVADSARDLREALADKKKTLRLTDDPQAADVQIIVDSRQGGPIKTVYATLITGSHEERLVASDDLFWTFAAENLAGQVDRWLKFNRVPLMAARQRAAARAGAPAAPPAER